MREDNRRMEIFIDREEGEGTYEKIRRKKEIRSIKNKKRARESKMRRREIWKVKGNEGIK